MTFDSTKSVVCHNGWSARIICTNCVDFAPIIALITRPNGTEKLMSYFIDGTSASKEYEFNLINVPEKVTRWIARLNESQEAVLLLSRPRFTDDWDTFYPIEIEIGRKE